MRASEAKKISQQVDVIGIIWLEVMQEIEAEAKKGRHSLLIKKFRIEQIAQRLVEYGYDVYQYPHGPYKVISWEKPTV